MLIIHCSQENNTRLATPNLAKSPPPSRNLWPVTRSENSASTPSLISASDSSKKRITEPLYLPQPSRQKTTSALLTTSTVTHPKRRKKDARIFYERLLQITNTAFCRRSFLCPSRSTLRSPPIKPGFKLIRTEAERKARSSARRTRALTSFARSSPDAAPQRAPRGGNEKRPARRSAS